jgi:integrase-like protein
MNGSVFKRCPCTEKTRRGKAAKQTRSCKKEHGSWYFVHDIPTADGRRPQIKRGGYPGKEEAGEALNKSLVRYGQRGVGAERDLASGRQTVADYLRGWIDRRKGLKASTKRSYRMHIETHLVPVLGTIRLDELGTGHIDAANEQLRQPRPRPSGERRRRAAAAAEAPGRQDGKPRLGRGELRRQIGSFMAERPGEDFAPHEVSRALGRG